ncbi:hypothetical protein ACFQX4_23555 [Roseomonas sp. GCM10028921]
MTDAVKASRMREVEKRVADDNQRLRERFAAEVGLLSSKDIADRAAQPASIHEAAVFRWRDEGRILSVTWEGKEMFPAYQFKSGQPHPAIKQVLDVLPTSMSDWQRAFWFVSANGWLDNREPVELLGQPDHLVAAAQHEAEEVIG